MSSVSRVFAQRKNNVVDVTPVLQTSGDWDGYYALNIDPRYASVFNVDLSGLETYVNTFNFPNPDQGRLNVYGQIDPNDATAPVVYFYINVGGTEYNPATESNIASAYPDLEFTVHFNRSEGVNPSLRLSVYPNNSDCDLLSPGGGFAEFNKQTLTLKSNGKQFVATASGPVTWSGTFDC